MNSHLFSSRKRGFLFCITSVENVCRNTSIPVTTTIMQIFSKKSLSLLLASPLLCFGVSTTQAAKPATKPATSYGGLPASVFKVPDGLEVTLWAQSPMLLNPTNMDIDVQGRIWVAEAVNYRNFKKHSDKTLAHPQGDRIMVLQDVDGDGVAEKSHVFVQDKDLVAPLGVAVLDNEIIVSCGHSLIVYRDVDRNAVFDPAVDKKDILLTGFGGLDHDHGLHSVVAGPDGRWHFIVGNAGPHVVTDKSGWTLRSSSVYASRSSKKEGYKVMKSDDGRAYVGGLALSINPDGTGLQVYSHNFRNSYELCVNSRGDIYQNDNDDQVQTCRTTWLMQHSNTGYFSNDGSRSWSADTRLGQSVAMSHWHQDDPGVLPFGDLYGAGSPTGIAFYEGDSFGPKYQGMLLSCEAGRNTVFGYKPKLAGGGMNLGDKFSFFDTGTTDDNDYKWKKVLDDKRKWFRPSDVAVGPDGAIYVADWYDPIVGGHAMHDKVGNGAIYRIAPKNKKLSIPKIDLTTTEGLLAAFKSPAQNVRWLGLKGLKKQGRKAIPEVSQLLNDPNPFIAARAVWLLAQLGEQGQQKVAQLLTHADQEIRVVAVRALRNVDYNLASDFPKLAVDPSAAVRREVALAMRDVPFEKCKEIITHLAQGYDGTDRTYLEALGTACEGKEEMLYPILLARLGAMPEKWSDPFADIVWRLHPALAIAPLSARATNNQLSSKQRKQAIDTLAFIPQKRSSVEMKRIASTGPEDHRKYAQWWLDFRKNNDWREWLKPTADQVAKVDPMLELKKTLLDKKASDKARKAAAKAMALSVSGGKMLIAMAREKQVPAAYNALVREHIHHNPDSNVKLDAKMFFALNENPTGATEKEIQEIVKLTGNVANGRTLFFQRGTCFSCHKSKDKGGNIGPDLTGVGKRFSTSVLVDAMVNPSSAIAFGFEMAIIKKTDGSLVSGFIQGEGDPVLIKDRYTGKQVAIAAKEIKTMTREKTSMMPSVKLLGLKPQEIADLAAFLNSEMNQ